MVPRSIVAAARRRVATASTRTRSSAPLRPVTHFTRYSAVDRLEPQTFSSIRRAFNTSSQRRNEAQEAAVDNDAVQAGIAKAVKTSPVVLFMKGTPEMPQCGFSRATVQILGLQGVDPAKFTAFNVLEDSDLRQGIKKYSDWPTIPQLYVGGEFVGGCDILMSMHQDGSLAQLLGEKGVVVEGDADSASDAKA